MPTYTGAFNPTKSSAVGDTFWPAFRAAHISAFKRSHRTTYIATFSSAFCTTDFSAQQTTN